MPNAGSHDRPNEKKKATNTSALWRIGHATISSLALFARLGRAVLQTIIFLGHLNGEQLSCYGRKPHRTKPIEPKNTRRL